MEVKAVRGWLLALTVLLAGFSVVMVYSTTGILSQERFGDSLYYVKRQGLAVIIGFVLMYLCSKIPVSIMKKISPACILACVL